MMNELIRVDLSEDWYNDRLGVRFEEDFWVDPIRRVESYRQMAYEVATKFPHLAEVGIGSKNPAPRPVAADQYGHRFVSKIFGCEIKYVENQAPSAVAYEYDVDQLSQVEVPDLHNSDVMKKAFDDARILKEKYGYVDGEINLGSPLNVAVSVFGADFIACCYSDPDVAQHVLMTVAKTLMRLVYEFSNKVDPNYRVAPFDFSIGNCPAIMFSPELYRKVILPVDQWLRMQCRHFGIHHCGVFDKYAQLYTALNPQTLDIGGGSDYTIVRRYFPDAICSYIVNAEYYEGKSREEIDAVVRNILENGGPFDKISFLWTYGTGRNATDENLIDLDTAPKRLFPERFR